MEEYKKVFCFRLDGGLDIGWGHIIRSSCIIKQLKLKSFKIIVFIKYYDNKVIEYLLSFDITVVKINNLRDIDSFIINNNIGKSNILIDTYRINSKTINHLNTTFDKTILYNDYIRDYPTNIILTLSYEEKNKYSKKQKIINGDQCLLVREKFFTTKNNIKSNASILVSLGGSDIYNFSYKLLQLLIKKYKFKDIGVIIGPSFSEKNIKKIKKNNSGVHIFSGTFELWDIFSKYNYIISSASTISYEILAMNKKHLIIQTEPNQNKYYNYLVKNNYSYGLGKNLDITIIEKKLSLFLEKKYNFKNIFLNNNVKSICKEIIK